MIVEKCIIELLGHCKGCNFNTHNLGVVGLFHLLKKGYKVLFKKIDKELIIVV